VLAAEPARTFLGDSEVGRDGQDGREGRLSA
jgi:hypothetical protein